jgi:hypothetical protein
MTKLDEGNTKTSKMKQFQYCNEKNHNRKKVTSYCK